MKKSDFKVGDKISVSWTVLKSILHGERHSEKVTKTTTGVVIKSLIGDKPGRVRVTFDVPDTFECPLCHRNIGKKLGFSVHPDDLKKIE
jgi:hypothetical protein